MSNRRKKTEYIKIAFIVSLEFYLFIKCPDIGESFSVKPFFDIQFFVRVPASARHVLIFLRFKCNYQP